MDEKTDILDILLSRYFSGEASEEELRLLDSWLAESAENEAYFEKMTLLFQHAAAVKPMPEPDVEKAFSLFSDYIKKENVLPQKSNVRRLIPYLSAAASIVLVIGIFTFFFGKQEDNYKIVALKENSKQLTLFNGVDVLLQPESVLKYDPANEEVILLNGEATFYVNSPASGNLLVKAGETFIRDIGTVFTVNAYYPNDSVTVKVAEGEILFYTKENKGVCLKESEKGTYLAKGDYFKAEMKAFEFNATPLPEVVRLLSSHYGTLITIDANAQSLYKMQLSASFTPGETIDNILKIISETLSIHVTKESDNSYVLSF